MNPRSTARAAGLAYLVIMIAAPFSEVFVRGGTIVSGDPAATAANILAGEQLWRLAIAAEFVTLACDVIVALLLYVLLKPAGKTVSLLAAGFQMVTVAVTSVKVLFHIAPLQLLEANGPWTHFSTPQLQELAYLALRMHGEAYEVALFLFGIHCLLIGWLIARATFLPRAFGWMLGLAGLCYLVSTIAGAVAPDFARMLFPWILLPALPAEGALTLWLLIRGVNAQRWREQALAM